MKALAEWESFYVIVGSAAGALIGLQFVVMTLVAERPALRVAAAGAAFSTPTIVHFSASLLLSALVRVPWPSIALAATVWGILGLAGAAYVVIVAWRMRTQTTYRPDFEDWLSNVLLPLVAYVALALSALAALWHAHEAFFGIGTAALLLLFVGIHNAWDAISYHVFVSRQKTHE